MSFPACIHNNLLPSHHSTASGQTPEHLAVRKALLTYQHPTSLPQQELLLEFHRNNKQLAILSHTSNA